MKTLPNIQHPPFAPRIVELGAVSAPDDAGMLNAQQAATFLGVSVHKVSRLVKIGDLPAYVWEHDKRQRLFDPDDLRQMRPRAVDNGNDWLGDTEDNRQALADLYQRFQSVGFLPDPDGGYSLPHLIAFIEQRGWAWGVEKGVGPWLFADGEIELYDAKVQRAYRPGLGGFTCHSRAWAPEVALARSVDQMLADEVQGRSILR